MCRPSVPRDPQVEHLPWLGSVQPPDRLVGAFLACENVCANSWQEVFLCLNEHLGMSTLLQASLLFPLPIYFIVVPQF